MRSLPEWNRRGYRVTKGSKAKSFKNGVAQFSEAQVHRPRVRNDHYSGPRYQMDDEQAHELSEIYGLVGHEGPGFFM